MHITTKTYCAVAFTCTIKPQDFVYGFKFECNVALQDWPNETTDKKHTESSWPLNKKSTNQGKRKKMSLLSSADRPQTFY